METRSEEASATGATARAAARQREVCADPEAGAARAKRALRGATEKLIVLVCAGLLGASARGTSRNTYRCAR